MIAGRVENRHALLPIVFRLAQETSLSVECVIDTGFTDALCLPEAAVRALGLPYRFDFPATLADGSEVLLPVHEGQVLWGETLLRVHVLATGTRPVVGTALSDGHERIIPFIEGGQVLVRRIMDA